ncbi:hypothetical protein CTEN210_01555 [Chaetoceros tenuissimus]|uniref:DUF4200 domain-containing protein n=1 Tax=Chaetoceros tenuissimus TaxID=426638 RepID=A0AAD3CHR5_9STRA|nr:hypothetical protein CTEN210_01555 [Chaetoceros tenuissimus]
MSTKQSGIDPELFDCTNTKILLYKRELNDLSDQLEEKKDECARELIVLNKKEEAIRLKDAKLQENIINFNKFLQENENKTLRANRRCNEARRQNALLDEEITSLKTQLEEMKLEEVRSEHLLEQNLCYKNYLQRVVDHVKENKGDLTEVNDILVKYNNLKQSTHDLVAQMKANTLAHEEKRAELVKIHKERGNELLKMNNDMARLQKELEQITLEHVKLQNEGNKFEGEEISAEILQIILAIDNIAEKLEAATGTTLNLKEKEGEDEEKVASAIEKLNITRDLLLDYRSIAERWEEEKSSKKE